MNKDIKEEILDVLFYNCNGTKPEIRLMFIERIEPLIDKAVQLAAQTTRNKIWASFDKENE
jgi:hypothetical protein